MQASLRCALETRRFPLTAPSSLPPFCYPPPSTLCVWVVAVGCVLKQALAKLREDGVCCDIRVVAGVGGKATEAHRVVLAARSAWFDALVRGKWQEQGRNEVTIEEVEGDALLAVVDFCYSGVVGDVTGDTVAALLHASSRLQVCLTYPCSGLPLI